MTINNPNEYLENIWDWAILNGCFGQTKIRPTDIDGFVERNGKFLVIEAKSPGVEVNTGQMITLKRLIDTGRFTVIIVWGKKDNPEQITLMTSRITKMYENASLTIFRDIVSRWFEWANQTTYPEFTE